MQRRKGRRHRRIRGSSVDRVRARETARERQPTTRAMDLGMPFDQHLVRLYQAHPDLL